MKQGIPKHRLFSAAIFFVAASVFFATFTCPASALTEVELSPVHTPNGAVLLIADGMSAPFIYPELTPYALDGTVLERARLDVIPEISDDSARLLELRVPQTFTEGGHSVLVTGNTKADSELVSFRDATIFDVLHEQGYLCIGVMEKGDSWSICAEQDAILRDKNNSIKKMTPVLESYEHASGSAGSAEHAGNVKVPPGLPELMEEKAARAPGYVSSKETGERYSGYNRWGIETACAIVEYMAEEYPGQKYLLTVNVGALDMSGHYRGNYAYLDCIESLDADLMPLYELCTGNDLAFILTADHGMAFPTDDSRGGHQGEKYTVSDEAQLVPLIVRARDVESGVIRGEFGQEDVASTLLGVLNVPGKPRFTDGEQIVLKSYVNLKVKLPGKGSAQLLKAGKPLAFPKNDDEFLFLGLEPDCTYKVRASFEGENGPEEKEEELFLETDSVVEFRYLELKPGAEDGSGIESATASETRMGRSSGTGNNGIFGVSFGHLIGYFLIGMINLTGLAIIAKILKKP